MKTVKIEPEMLNKKSKVKAETKSYYTEDAIGADEMVESLNKAIITVLEQHPIVIEPSVYCKMMCMMAAVNGEVEIYGKLIVEIEEFISRKYALVKDIYIPYQTVTGASFNSDVKQMARWMIELNRDENGDLIAVDEVNNMTRRMLGHFHSHDSVSGVGASQTDTDDMIEHVAGRSFWVEIIGTKDKLAGRIALSTPFDVIAHCPVVVKWWGESENVIGEAENKVNKKTYTYTKNDEEDKKTKGADDEWYYDNNERCFKQYGEKGDDEDYGYGYRYDNRYW